MRHPSLIPLAHDHHHGLALALRCRKQALGQMKPVGIEGLRERAKEFRNFVSENLERHFQAEEEILFPFIRSCIPQSITAVDTTEFKKTQQQLEDAMTHMLSGFVTICATCKKIRDDKESWLSIEEYAAQQMNFHQFSHGLCPNCFERALQ